VAELLNELLARCRRGDRDAVAVLVARFDQYARAVAAALLDRRDAASVDDVVQAAFVTVLLRLGDVRDAEAFPGWLRQVVRTEVQRLARRRRGRPGHTTPATDLPAAREPSPAEAAERSELAARVREAVAALPPAGRETVEAFYLDGRDQVDVADRLGVPLGTVKRRLHDARAKLRDLLADDAPPPAPSRRDDRRLPL
jgi:RNA polymerase sigma-70 factor (ECF subfamily)